MLLPSALLGCLFFAPLDRDTVIPEPVVIRVRMLFLRPGMDRRQVEAVLRMGRRVGTGTFNLRRSSDQYFIGTDHTLRLDYRYDFDRDRSVLVAAELTRGGKQVARVPSTMREGKGPPNAPKGIDPGLVEAAIRALQGHKSTGKR